MVHTLPVAPRIAVFRALQLGDLLCATPALRMLRRGLPHAEITLVGLPSTRDLCARLQGLIDRFEPFPGAPGLPEQPFDEAAWSAFVERMRLRRFDLAIQLHGSGEHSNPVVRAMRATRMAGFVPDGEPTVEGFLRWPSAEHEVHRLIGLMRSLGLPDAGEELALPLRDEDRLDAQALRRAHRLTPRLTVLIHPGARFASRRWPIERFAQVADALERDGWRVAVTGAADEAPIAQELVARLGGRIENLCGRTSLGALGALLADSRLLVCNDTGVSHLAAALGTPSVVTACGSDVQRWGPLDRDRHRVLWRPMACRPCMHRRCPTAHECATGLGVDTVMDEVRRQLRRAERQRA